MQNSERHQWEGTEAWTAIETNSKCSKNKNQTLFAVPEGMEKEMHTTVLVLRE